MTGIDNRYLTKWSFGHIKHPFMTLIVLLANGRHLEVGVLCAQRLISSGLPCLAKPGRKTQLFQVQQHPLLAVAELEYVVVILDLILTQDLPHFCIFIPRPSRLSDFTSGWQLGG